MRFILTVSIALVACSVVLSQVAQDERQRYSYHIWGSVFDGQSQAMPRTTVCFVPAERPINGRIPCNKTDDKGDFAFTVKDIPDKYTICASTTDSPYIFFEQDKGKAHRATCTAAIEFGAKDECRKITLTL